MDDETLLILAGAALAYYLYTRAQTPATTPGVPVYSTTPTPYSIYPEYGYTQTTSMAAHPTQKASTVIQPVGLYTAMQSQNAWAMQTQCAGSLPGCTPLLGDTQLGL